MTLNEELTKLAVDSYDKVIQKEWHEKSEGVYMHCQICGTLFKEKNT